MRDKNTVRVLGLDIGSNTIGIAVSDELGITAQGIETLRRKSMEQDLKEISALISQFGVGRIVVGLPRNMDGTIGPQAEKVLQWVESAKEKIFLPIETWDERLSTVQATRVLLDADLSRRKRRRVIDKLAAVIILQGYLDSYPQNR